MRILYSKHYTNKMKQKNSKEIIVKALDNLNREETNQVSGFIKSIQRKSKPDTYLKFRLRAMQDIREALTGAESTRAWLT